MTLSCYTAEFSRKFADLEMKIDPYCQRQNCTRLNVAIAFILVGVLVLGGGVKQGCGRKTCCFDLDGVIEDFVRFNDQRKDNFGLQTSWQQCQTLDSYNVSVALLHCECVTR